MRASDIRPAGSLHFVESVLRTNTGHRNGPFRRFKRAVIVARSAAGARGKWIGAAMGRLPGRRLIHWQADARAVSRRCRTAAERRLHQCSRFRTRIHPGHTGRAGTARRCLRCFRTRHRMYMLCRHPQCTGTPSEELRSSGLHSPAATCTGCEVRRRRQPCTRC